MNPRLTSRKGATTPEYILILTLVLGLLVLFFWNSLFPALADKLRQAGFDIELPGKKSLATSGTEQAPPSGQKPKNSGGLFSGWFGSDEEPPTPSGGISYGGPGTSTSPVTAR